MKRAYSLKTEKLSAKKKYKMFYGNLCKKCYLFWMGWHAC